MGTRELRGLGEEEEEGGDGKLEPPKEVRGGERCERRKKWVKNAMDLFLLYFLSQKVERGGGEMGWLRATINILIY